ncbi:MAG: sensor histidine kinase [Clostridia bacterium]
MMILEKCLSRFKRLSIRKSLGICLVALIVLPLLVTAFLIHHQVTNELRRQIWQNQLQSLRQTRNNVSSLLREVDTLSISLLSNSVLQEYCTDLLDGPSQQEDPAAYSLRQQNMGNDLMNTTADLALAKVYIHSISVSQGDTDILRYGTMMGPSARQYDEVATGLGGKGYWTPVYRINYDSLNRTELPVISYVRSVNDLNWPRQLAIERITISEKYLCSIFDPGGTLTGEASASPIFIMHRDGTVVSAPDRQMLGKPWDGYAAVSAQIGADDGYFSRKVDQGEQVVFYAPIDNTDWVLMQVTKERVLNRSLRMIDGIIILSIGLCVLFGFFYSLIQRYYVLNPITALSREMTRVKDGDFNVRLQIATDNELGQLSHLFLDMTSRIESLIKTVYQIRLKEREAELKALQMQINPHFLYNTLDSIYWLAYKNRDYAVSEQIAALSDMFKHALNSGNETTTIAEELHHMEQYLFIQKNRLGERIRLEVQADPSLMACRIMKLILQPLVENAVVHGLEARRQGGTIWITIARQDEMLCLTVRDDGVGADAQRVMRHLEADEGESGETIFALKNIYERLKMRFGAQASMQFQSVPDEGTTVVICFPIVWT